VRPRTFLGACLLLCTVASSLLWQRHLQGGKPATRRDSSTGRSIETPSRNEILASVARLPLYFEPNRGQVGTRSKFLARGEGYAVLLSSTEALVALRSRAQEQPGLRIRFLGASRSATLAAQGQLPGKSNYLLGSNPSRWRTNVPHFARVNYKQIYPGIDLAFYGGQEALEFDVAVAPSTDFTRFVLAVEGAEELALDASGDLRIRIAGEQLVLRKPAIYQPAGNLRRFVEGGYKVLRRGRVAFWAKGYDRRLPLIIDPSLTYSTFLGGSDDDSATGVTVDSTGKVYIAGSTKSLDFPTQPAQPKPGGSGNYDMFVTKIDTSQSGAASLVYSTYLGGSKDDKALGIAVDGLGNSTVAGVTNSPDFPTLNAFKSGFSGPSDTSDITVTKLNPTGSGMIFSTYFGGSSTEGTGAGGGVAVDNAGSVYITSDTESNDLFTSVGAFQSSLKGSSDAFVTKFSATGAVLYSTYLGGSGAESGTGIAVDTSGIYVAGITSSSDFITKNAFQASFAGGASDAFVVELNPQGQGQADLLYSTYLGGSDQDQARAIAVDSFGNVCVTGDTVSGPSNPFPTTTGAYQPALAGGQDAFVAQLNPTATGAASLLYSTYFGGTSNDSGRGITVNSLGKIYVTGVTSSADFPSVGAIQGSLGGAQDAFVAKFDPSVSGKASLVYSTFLGGAANDCGNAIAADSSGNAFVAGQTLSNNFPVTASSYQGACKSCSGTTPLADAFLAKLSDAGAAPAANFNPPFLNFGNVPLGMTGVPGTVALSNTGNAVLQINSIGITGSTDFSQTNNCPSSLAAGAPSCSIVVTFKPTTAASETASITVSDNVAGSPQMVPLSGTGTAPAAVTSTMSIDFGNQPVGTTSNAATVTLTDSGNAPLTISSVNISGTNSSDFAPTEDTCPIAPGTLAAGSSCVVGVTFSPMANGPRMAQLVFTDDSNNASGSTQVVRLTGTGTPPTPVASLVPSSHDFGSVNVGATSGATTFTLSNRGNLTLHVASIQLTGNTDFAFVAAQSPACPLGATSQLAPNASCNLAVTFKPSAAGGEAAQIVVTDDSGNTPGTTQAASLTGTGAAPVASVSPTSLTTAGQLVGTASAPAPIMLKNTGTGLLNYQISFAGANPGDFTETDTCGGTVNQGTTCNLMVAFAPKMTGSRSGMMIITDNSNGVPNSQQSVSLAGTGTDFSFQPASGGSTSATVSAGQSATFNLQLMPADGFAGAVSLSCTDAPSEAMCAPSPGSLNVSNSSAVPFTVTVTTTAPSLLPPGDLRRPGLIIVALMSLIGFLRWRWRPHAGRTELATARSFIAFAALLLLAGCNAATSSGGGNPGTPRGTYTLTVSGTQQGASRTINLTLIVR